MSRDLSVLPDATPEFAFEISDSRLRPPPARPGTVTRTALLERLDATTAPVISVVAPAGFGKSTVLAQWAARRGPRVAWLSVDERDNDPQVLVSHLVAAVASVVALDAQVVEGVNARRPPASLVDRTLHWLAQVESFLAIVIDGVDDLMNPMCVSIVTALALGMPFQHRLVIGAREAMRWPAGRMRAEGRLAEFGAAELALASAEATELLDKTGVTLPRAEADELIARNEGWAAGLYLSALAIQSGSSTNRLASIPRGDHPYFADYLRSELIDGVSEEELAFLTRASVLERLNGALCDDVLGVVDSDARLDEIARRNLMLLPIDDRSHWYRYHPIFRELLRSELERREPDGARTLHQRAAAWYESNGFGELAIGHAQSARDVERSVRLLHDLMQPVWASGRSDTVLGWMGWFGAEQLIDVDAVVAANGALMYALNGRPVEAEHWADAAERAPVVEKLRDGSTGMSMVQNMRAFLCRGGPDASGTEAARAYEGLSPASPFRPSMLFAQGTALAVQGKTEDADAVFKRAYDGAIEFDIRPLAAMILAERAAIAVSANGWDDAVQLVDEAVALVDGGMYDEYWSSALVFAWAARAALHRSDHERARAFLVRASRLRPLLTYALPLVSLQALLELGRSYLALGDAAGARAVLRQANDILAQRPLIGLSAELQTLRDQVESGATAAVGASSLTAAELRLLPLLATHLSLREIAAHLYVSRNTVKSQTISVYRKLGVSSRSEAIAHVRESGLLVQ